MLRKHAWATVLAVSLAAGWANADSRLTTGAAAGRIAPAVAEQSTPSVLTLSLTVLKAPAVIAPSATTLEALSLTLLGFALIGTGAFLRWYRERDRAARSRPTAVQSLARPAARSYPATVIRGVAQERAAS